MQVKLDSFEGPIDLLVYLVQKNEMDIKNIRLSAITAQYLEILRDLSDQKIEVAAEFLLMASTLIYIKSKSLLPDSENAEEILPEALSIKEELIKKIQEYQVYRELSRKIYDYPWKNRDFFVRPSADIEVIKEKSWIPVEMTDLVNCYQKCLMESRRILTMVKREYKSVAQKVTELKDILIKDPHTEFSSLLPADPVVPEIVITFISILELSRLKYVELSQEGPMAPIKITVIDDLNNLNVSHLTGFDKLDEKPKVEKEGSHEQASAGI